MRKVHYYLLILLLAYCNDLQSQNMIISAGDYHEDQFYSLDWVIGESVIEEFRDENMMIHSGFLFPMDHFHQNNIVNNSISLYPNPSKDFVSIKLDQYPAGEELKYDLLETNGKLVRNGIVYNHARLDLLDLRGGLYLLYLYSYDDVYIDKLVKY